MRVKISLKILPHIVQHNPPPCKPGGLGPSGAADRFIKFFQEKLDKRDCVWYSILALSEMREKPDMPEWRNW